MSRPRIGGAFAPPLTDELLTKYGELIAGLDAQSQIRDAMTRLLHCCKAWWDQPESNGGKSRPHASGTGTVVDLDEPVAKALWEVIPWGEDLNVMSVLFDGIDATTQKPLRDAAHHLLWHAKELELDREPLTADKL